MTRLSSAWLRHLNSIFTGKRSKNGSRLKPVQRRVSAIPRLEMLEERVNPTHLRYGNITYTPTVGTPDQITFHVTESFRQTGYPSAVVGSFLTDTIGGNPSLNYGDGTNSNGIEFEVTAVNTTEAGGGFIVVEAVHNVGTTNNPNWVEGLVHQYTTAGNYTAYIQSSARLSTLVNNANGEYRFQTTVNVGTGDTSPVSSLPPIVQVGANTLNSFQIPAIESDGNPLLYRLSTSTEASGSTTGFTQPTDLTVSSTGLVTWDLRTGHGVTTSAGDLWSAQVTVEELNPTTQAVISTMPLDFILEVVSATHHAPVVVANPTGPFDPVAGQQLTFQVTASDTQDEQFGDTITNLQALNPPQGMTFTAVTGSNPASFTATWTPTQAQVGQAYIVTFQATTSASLTGETSVTINPQQALNGVSSSITGGVEGVTAATLSAAFTDATTTTPSSAFTATINWGDGGPTSQGTVTGSGGNYSVTGSHLYAEDGPYNVSILVQDNAGNSTTINGTTTVVDAPLTAGTASISGGVEGVTAASLSAGFTDANTEGLLSDFTATINWGDGGPTSTGTVSGSAGHYTIAATHLYGEEGPYNVSIAVADAGGSSTTITGSTTVTDAPLTAGSASISGGVEGVTAAGLTATFTDANIAAPVGDFTATITWGDGGPTSTGTITGNDSGQYTIAASHVYAEDGPYNVSIAVVDKGGSSTTITGSTTVADAPLTATGTTISVVAGTSFTKVVASFSDANPNPNISDFSSTINWNDGTTSAGTIAVNGSTFTVTGTNNYHKPGTFAISISITDVGGSTASASTTANVGDASLQASAPSILNFTEGSPFSGQVASFIDGDQFYVASDFTVSINWGDGSSASPGTVSGSSGSFTVNGSHTYAEEGTYGITVSVSDAGGATASAGITALVADAPLTAGAFTPPVATEGAPFTNVVIFHFTDADPNGTASDYSALVTLGDGSTVTLTSTPSVNGQIVASQQNLASQQLLPLLQLGGFDVQLSHTYLEELTNQTFSVVVTDNPSTASASTNTFSVADAALSSTGVAVSATEGAPFSGTVATFTDADPNGTVSDYTATINWGDGSGTSAGTITSNGAGGFNVSGTHTYAEEGSPSVSVTIKDAGGSTTSATSTATVADAALSATAVVVSATEGAPFSGTVATFTDADPNGTVSDYTATINWGDGTSTSAGTITSNGSGGFNVSGTHTYAEEGSPSVSVTINDIGGSSSSTNQTADVADAPLSDISLIIHATEGVPFTGKVASFTDADPNGTVSDYTALIYWGDGTSSPGTIQADSNIGGFDVLGTHTYAEEGTYPAFLIDIADVGGATTGADDGEAIVADAPLTAGTFTPPAATEGVPISNAVIFHFTDADPNGTASDYTAVVTRGDGTTATLTSTPSANGQIVANGNGFDVQFSYTYTSVVTSQTFGVVVTDHFATASASSNNFSVGKAVTTTAVSSSQNPSTFGQSVTFTATVTSGSIAFDNGGTVQFAVDGSNFGSPATLSGGIATINDPALSGGSHTVTATYSGDTSFSGSMGTLTGGQTVNKGTTTTAVISSLNPSDVGQTVTFTATVTPGAGSFDNGGTVQFAVDGSNFEAPKTLSGGIATITDAALTVSGSPHTITATYSGDTNYSGSNGSLSGGQVVNPVIVLSPLTLPPDTVGILYNSQTITASGGTGNKHMVVTETNALGFTVPVSGTNSIVISGTPTVSGTETFSIVTTDDAGVSITTPYSIVVNAAVTLSPGTLPIAPFDVAYNQTITALGGTGNKTISVTETHHVSGFIIPTTGVNSVAITGTPNFPDTETFTVTATDTLGSTTTVSYSITVPASRRLDFNAAPDTPFVVTAPGFVPAQAGDTIATTGDAWIPYAGAPAGQPVQTFNTHAGISPVTSPPSAANLLTQDWAWGNTLQTFQILVAPGTAYDLRLYIGDSRGAFDSTHGAYSEDVRAYSGAAGSSTGAFTFVSSPSGGFNYVVLSGIAPNTTGPNAGIINVDIEPAAPTPNPYWVLDGMDIATTGTLPTPAFTPSPTITLSPGSISSDTVGTPYPSQPIAASGGTGTTTLVVSNVANAIAGLSITGGGTNPVTVVGTPTAAGTETFRVTATDSTSNVVYNTYSITVNQPLTLTPGTLPGVGANLPYSAQTITANGGTGSKTLVVSNVVNPIAGLSVTGSGLSSISVSGTPTTGGTETFTVTATDAAGSFTSINYSITVATIRQYSFNTVNLNTAPFVAASTTVANPTVNNGWTTTGVATANGNPLNGHTNPLYGSFAYANTEKIFQIKDAPGSTYSLRVYAGDGRAGTAYSMDVRAYDNALSSPPPTTGAGAVPYQNITTSSGTNGGFNDSVVLTGITPTSGIIDFDIKAHAGGYWVLNAVQVWATGGPTIDTDPGLISQKAASVVTTNAVPVLTPAQLAPIAAEAVARLTATGLNSSQVAALNAATFQIINLSQSGNLGLTGLGSEVVELDGTGDGQGWYYNDLNPGDNSAFTVPVAPTQLDAATNSPAAGKYDLLTVVEHELEHVIGVDDLSNAAAPYNLLATTLGTGERRFPEALGSAAVSSAEAIAVSGSTAPTTSATAQAPLSASPSLFDLSNISQALREVCAKPVDTSLSQATAILSALDDALTSPLQDRLFAVAGGKSGK